MGTEKECILSVCRFSIAFPIFALNSFYDLI